MKELNLRSWVFSYLVRFEGAAMKANRNNKGFSIIEVLSTIALLGFVGTAYVHFSTVSGINSRHALHASLATNVAESVAEDLSMIPSSNIWLSSQAELPPTFPYPFKRFFTRDCKETTNLNLAFYTVSWIVTPDKPIAGARSIGMTVQWIEGGMAQQLGMRVVR